MLFKLLSSTLSAAALITSFTALSQVYGDVIQTWDFASGIPNDWENNSQNGIAVWEYRGPSTEPNNTVGSLGSCNTNSLPIASPTADNGFVIFDSNFWDDPNGPCGNLGSGPDPAPHLAWLTTAQVNLASQTNVVLTFRQQYRHFNTTTRVLISTDGGSNWNPIHTNPTNPSAQSAQGVWVSVNISSQAGGQADVRFKFEFTGTYYWWLLDDITLYVPSQNDLIIENPTYTLFSGSLEPDGFGDMPYGGWPAFMAPPLNFRSRITNVGGLVQNQVRMNIRVTNSQGSVVFTENSTTQNLNPNGVYNASMSSPYTPPSAVDRYTVRFKAEQTQTDETPLNNELNRSFYITNYSYQHDQGAVEDVFIPSGIYANESYQIGNLYESRTAGNRFHSIGVGLTAPTQPGSIIYGIVYNLSRDSIIGVTDPYEVNAWDINEIGSERIVHLQLQEDIITDPEFMYTVMVGSEVGGSFYVGRSGDATTQASLIRYPEINGLFYLLKAPIVRAHLFPGSSVPGCLDPEAMNYDASANTDDGSCRYPGCIDASADNYNPNANFDDASCFFVGCTDSEAANYNANATLDDGSCQYPGCNDQNAQNFNPDSNVNDGSCIYSVAFLSSTDSTGCVPHQVTFFNQTALAEDGNCTFYLDGELIESACVDSFTLDFDTPGSYFITYDYEVSGNSSSYELGPIVVHPLPEVPVLSYNEEINVLSCVNCSGNTVSWFLNGVLVPNQNNSSWSPIDNGEYSVVVTSVDGCISEGDTLLVIVVSVEEQGLNSVSIYPNPARDVLTVRSGAVMETLMIFDARGRLVYEHLHPAVQAEINLNLFEQGVYNVVVRSAHGIDRRQIVVVK
jgi:hypothetical protein